MLEDRKFYFPIAAEYKPYRELTEYAVPGRGCVAMGDHRAGGGGDAWWTKDPFVGKHTPQVRSGRWSSTARPGRCRRAKTTLAISGWRPRSPQPRWMSRWSGARTGQWPRKTIRIDGLNRKYRRHPLKFTAGADTDKAMLEIRVTRRRGADRHSLPHARRQHPRHAGRHTQAAQATRRDDLSLARRQFRQRLRLA